MAAIRPKIGIVPIWMREIEINLDLSLVCGVAELLHHITFEGRFHDAVGQVALLHLWSSRGGPVDPLVYASLCVEHGETFMMFCREGKHLHATLMKNIHPSIGIETNRIPRFVQLVVFLPVLE